ncbi:inositol 1,4,5-trisphosphate receptor type 1-like [Polypterus senegalus]|uniref:inositol 1,4,5-trisphosphate receptor type 1-like n=1 Tax=Polypterus senegalus TaxID=55291 RepID=UPI00196497C3|nr:inositol 1,4,5-trisphosphate receptor type 1-like [Polypterus senegalus]
MSWRMSARNAARRDSVLAASRDYRNIIERLQDIVSALEDRLRPLVQAELSVLVDVLHRPELLFPENTDARRKCESGGFICKLIKHTKQLLEENEEKLCIKVLQTLREMMTKDRGYGEKLISFDDELDVTELLPPPLLLLLHLHLLLLNQRLLLRCVYEQVKYYCENSKSSLCSPYFICSSRQLVILLFISIQPVCIVQCKFDIV